MSDVIFDAPLQASDSAYLDIPAPTWGLQGPFAFNVWLSQSDKAGNGFQYILSSRNPSAGPITDTSVFLPNQVGLDCPWILIGLPGSLKDIMLLNSSLLHQITAFASCKVLAKRHRDLPVLV